MTKRKQVEARIRELCPDTLREDPQSTGGAVMLRLPIRLSHVLRASRAKNKGEREIKDRTEDFLMLNWPLPEDSLDACSDETIEFLHGVLCQ